MKREEYSRAAARLLADYQVEWIVYEDFDGLAFPRDNQVVAHRVIDGKTFLMLAHEIGHCVLHYRSRPRWREELEAWDWAVGVCKIYGVPVTHGMRRFMFLRLEAQFRRSASAGATPPRHWTGEHLTFVWRRDDGA